ncbi:hypothetical protein BD560DRAFT_422146 [Blakeslea trispora]|nr:hypothetical protein BD560DRAFT_422146 [Blakeslea trispora]
MDENGNDSMDINGCEDPYKSEEVVSYSAYMEARKKLPKQKNWIQREKKNTTKNKRVSNEAKVQAAHLVDIHLKNSARAVALDLGLEPRSLQRWYSTWKKDPDSFCKTIGRPRIIEAEAMKNAVAEFN